MTKQMKFIEQPMFNVKDTPIGDFKVTEGSFLDDLCLPKAYDYANVRGAVLQSFEVAAVVRLAISDTSDTMADGAVVRYQYHDSDTRQTSTLAIGFIEEHKPVVAYAELPGTTNDEINFVNEVYGVHLKDAEFFAKKNHPVVARLIAASQKHNRVVSAFKEDPLRLSPLETEGGSEYYRNQHVIAAFKTRKVAEMTANYLSKRTSKMTRTVRFSGLTETDLEKVLNAKNKDKVVVRAVGFLGRITGSPFFFDSDVYTHNKFNATGCARGVFPYDKP